MIVIRHFAISVAAVKALYVASHEYFLRVNVCQTGISAAATLVSPSQLASGNVAVEQPAMSFCGYQHDESKNMSVRAIA